MGFLCAETSCYVVRRGQWDSPCAESSSYVSSYTVVEIFFQRIILFWGCGAEYQTQGLGYVGPVLLAPSYTPSPLLTFPLIKSLSKLPHWP